MTRDHLHPEVAAALKTLAKHGRVFAVVIPRGIPTSEIVKLQRDVNARLDQLAAERGPIS